MPDPRDLHDDPDAPATDEERARAEDLRAALEDPSRASDDAELARALAAAFAPADLPADEHARLVRAAVARRGRGPFVRVAFGAGAALMLAAGVALVVRGAGLTGGAGPAPAALAVSRSTQALFPERFAREGGESARIDRIAVARAADLRDNEFATWGVR